MKIMMLTWEFPPRAVGGISPHVYNLSLKLKRLGVDVCVVTCDFPDAPIFEDIDGIHVYRVDSYRFPVPDFTSWVYMMNTNLKMTAAKIISSKKEEINLIHAHDWLVAITAIGLKHVFRRPLIVTVHSTEYGRRNGIHSNYQKTIHETEVWLAHEAWRTICCSNYMASQVSNILGLQSTNIDVIPNGIDLKMFAEPYKKKSFRNQFAHKDEKLVLFVGRLVHEKGVLVLLDAMRQVLLNLNAKLVIAGTGYLKEEITRRALEMGISQKVFLTGFLDDRTLRLLYRTADVCVVPSLYEPFGIVALEAMAAKTPVVVSQIGGLSEIVEHDRTGVVIYPDNAASLAWGIMKILHDEKYADWIRLNAFNQVSESYTWENIAKKTLAVYERVSAEYKTGDWKPIIN